MMKTIQLNVKFILADLSESEKVGLGLGAAFGFILAMAGAVFIIR